MTRDKPSETAQASLVDVGLVPKQKFAKWTRFSLRVLFLVFTSVAILLVVLVDVVRNWRTSSFDSFLDMSDAVIHEDAVKQLWGCFCFDEDGKMSGAFLAISQGNDQYPDWFSWADLMSDGVVGAHVFINGRELIPKKHIVAIVISVDGSEPIISNVPFSDLEAAGFGYTDLFDLVDFWNFVKDMECIKEQRSEMEIQRIPHKH